MTIEYLNVLILSDKNGTLNFCNNFINLFTTDPIKASHVVILV